ncbi:MAG TPA: NAD(P)/FAD-dependent oxidoreductase, partial [Pseudomonadales bacterium]|nr:NAD(P)/FAD-dependent oxidoreductase [Pseudomonadales bacterium]
MSKQAHPLTVAIIGGGPAGLMAADVLSQSNANIRIDLYDAMPSLGRKFLMAGKGGMNISHAEPLEQLLPRYQHRKSVLAPLITAFGPEQIRAWMHSLGFESFVGSSGKIFPKDLKAAPLLRAWLHRLRTAGVRCHARHQWLDWDAQQLRFNTPDGEKTIQADATILALGGASWPQLGSSG